MPAIARAGPRPKPELLSYHPVPLVHTSRQLDQKWNSRDSKSMPSEVGHSSFQQLCNCSANTSPLIGAYQVSTAPANKLGRQWPSWSQHRSSAHRSGIWSIKKSPS